MFELESFLVLSEEPSAHPRIMPNMPIAKRTIPRMISMKCRPDELSKNVNVIMIKKKPLALLESRKLKYILAHYILISANKNRAIRNTWRGVINIMIIRLEEEGLSASVELWLSM